MVVLFLIFFPSGGLGFKFGASCLQSKSHLGFILLWLVWIRCLAKYLPWLTLNHDLSHLSLPSNCAQLVFNFLRNLHTDFHSSCSNLHSFQQHIRISFSHSPSLYNHQHFLFVFLIIAILTGMR
jgi:hypothetical protein